MAEINPTANQFTKKSFSKSINRRSTKVDLTPMVDLGFLLITFFVFTSAMSTPKVMDLFETKDAAPRPVKLSGAMTILLAKNQLIYYYYGMLDTTALAQHIYKTDLKGIRNLVLAKSKKTKPGDLMYIIKAEKNSTFGDNMNLLDEMSICNIPPGHYAEADISTAEETSINKTIKK